MQLFSGNQRISDLSLKVIGLMCPNLEHLYIADCQRLTDAALKSLTSCRFLTVANFADCVRYVNLAVTIKYMKLAVGHQTQDI